MYIKIYEDLRNVGYKWICLRRLKNISTKRKRSIRNAGVSERSHYPPNRIENFTLHLPIFCAQENDFNYCSIRNSRKITLFISLAECFREWTYYCSICNSRRIPLSISLAECFRKWIYYYCSICNSRKISLFISLV